MCWPATSGGGGGRSGDAVDDRVLRRAYLEDDLVDLVVDQRFERLLRQVDVRAGGVDPDVVGDVEQRVEQRAVVGVVGRAHRDKVGDDRGPATP